MGEEKNLHVNKKGSKSSNPSADSESITQNINVPHSGHQADKRFKHYFYEFFMMFLAVFAGFIAENIREDYLEHKKAGEYAKMLKNDLTTDTLLLQHLISNKDKISIVSSEAQKYFNTSEEQITIGELRHRQNGTSIDLSYFIPNDATISQLKSSGALRFFKNPELVNRLSNYELSIKKFTDLYNHVMDIYGGLQSEHILQYEIQLNKFLRVSAKLDSSILAKKAGYRFQSRDEFFEIMKGIIEFYHFWADVQYPELKAQAKQIIYLLNKEYHLE